MNRCCAGPPPAIRTTPDFSAPPSEESFTLPPLPVDVRVCSPQTMRSIRPALTAPHSESLNLNEACNCVHISREHDRKRFPPLRGDRDLSGKTEMPARSERDNDVDGPLPAKYWGESILLSQSEGQGPGREHPASILVPIFLNTDETMITSSSTRSVKEKGA